MESVKQAVCGLLLAGGRASRLGGEDKGLVELCGQPLIAHGIRRLSPQVDTLLISANRNLPRYRDFGLAVIEDEFGDFEGPLAGLLRGLEACEAPLLATLPCDAPLAPPDLVERLHAALKESGARAAIADDGERLQPLFGLFRRELAPDLADWLGRGGRKVQDWVTSLRPAVVDFSHCPQAFRNVNTPGDLAALRQRLGCAEES